MANLGRNGGVCSQIISESDQHSLQSCSARGVPLSPEQVAYTTSEPATCKEISDRFSLKGGRQLFYSEDESSGLPFRRMQFEDDAKCHYLKSTKPWSCHLHRLRKWHVHFRIFIRHLSNHIGHCPILFNICPILFGISPVLFGICSIILGKWY